MSRAAGGETLAVVRMQDVADRAQVSIATVSFVVNGSKAVSASTREKVEAAMRDLGYRPNAVARALATNRSRIIAMPFPDLGNRMNPTVLRIVGAAVTAAAEQDHHLVLWPVANDADALRGYLDGGLVDGVLLMEVEVDDARVAVLDEAALPSVLIGRTGDTTGRAFVDVDFEGAVEAGVERLRDLGHERIGLLLAMPAPLGSGRTSPQFGPLWRTEAAYRALLAEHGVPAAVLHCERSAAGGRRAAEQLLREAPEVTAVLAMNDEAASGFVRGLQSRGVRVPADVSVIGIATTPAAADDLEPPLDHLVSPAEQLGRTAAEALIRMLNADPEAQEPPLAALLPCTWQRGGTLAPVRSSSAPSTS